MFIQLKLKNFRQHLDRVFDFQGGVIALRGANEAGKTGMLEAIGYALGGATMLRESLDDVVTWGQKVSSLRVWLTFQINGVQYTISRGKSGAEISTEDRIEATGQTEVTRFVETLLGCSVKTATQLMLANQQKLRGTLEEDGAAMKLIEQLADFQLIDRYIALVQKHLPCGTTSMVMARIETLQEQVKEEVMDDTGPLRLAREEAVRKHNDAGEAYSGVKAVYDSIQEAARNAQARLDAAAAAAQKVNVTRGLLAQAKATFERIQPVPGPSEARITELRKQFEDESRFKRAQVAWTALQALPEPMWEGTALTLQEAHDKIRIRHTDIAGKIAELNAQIREQNAMRINQSACGLCGKDLAKVPEVAKKNAAIDTKVAQLEAESLKLATEIGEVEDEVLQYQEVLAAGRTTSGTFQKYSEFIELDHDFVPAKWTWTGPDISQQVVSVANELNLAVSQQQAYQRDLGRQQQAQAAVDAAERDLEAASLAEVAARSAVGDAQRTLDEAAAITSELFEAEQAYRAADHDVEAAQRELSTAQQMLKIRQDARQQVVDQLDKAKKELASMEFNNVLVDTLRKARPSIVEELWNLVGTSVSDTFSAIRGVPSAFVREADSFTVDGRGIKGLSGSTLDALGLAIRMSLTKTFLPNTRFMVLDEPAAAADPDRETNMLGVIAAGDFEQVLLVTHSDLADSFAAQVVQL